MNKAAKNILSKPFSKGLKEFTYLPGKVREFQLFCLLANTWHYTSNFSCFGGYVTVSQRGFQLNFPNEHGQILKAVCNFTQLMSHQRTCNLFRCVCVSPYCLLTSALFKNILMVKASPMCIGNVVPGYFFHLFIFLKLGKQ